jgi:hypothetical protein
MLIALLKHPHVAFDIYAHDIVMRLIGSLYCSRAWLSMKKLDKLVQEVHFNLNSANSAATPAVMHQCINVVHSLLDTLNSSLRIQPFPHSQVCILIQPFFFHLEFRIVKYATFF